MRILTVEDDIVTMLVRLVAPIAADSGLPVRPDGFGLVAAHRDELRHA